MTSGFDRLITMLASILVIAAWTLIALAPIVLLLVAVKFMNVRQRKRSKHIRIVSDK